MVLYIGAVAASKARKQNALLAKTAFNSVNNLFMLI
jgi:hypothetical protein